MIFVFIFLMWRIAFRVFYVSYTLEDVNRDIQNFDFDQEEGLDAGHTVKAVAIFESFTIEDID